MNTIYLVKIFIEHDAHIISEWFEKREDAEYCGRGMTEGYDDGSYFEIEEYVRNSDY